MQASFAPDAGDGSAIGQAPENTTVSPASIGMASFFAPAQPVQVAEVFENIPGDFKAPENPPLPPSRPDFGDRVQVAEAPASPAIVTPAQAGFAPVPAQQPGLIAQATPDVTGSTPVVAMNTPTSPTTARAEAASLGAYEYKTAGAPLPEGGLRATNIAYAPAQFELAGVSPSVGRTGGLRWRAAYDTVETNCFPETLRRALDQLATHFKSEVLVTSGARDRGRRGSLHRSCKAADVRVVGVSPGEVARVARTIPGINGVGTYRRVAVTHIDVRAERFAWRW